MILKYLLTQEWAKYVGILLIGITIGVVFYPTKTIEEKLTQKHQEEIAIIKESHSKETKDLTEKLDTAVAESKSLKQETSRTIAKLSDEVKTLKTKQKTSTYKLVKPDGTIEERTFSESEVDESSHVITQIQEEFKTKVEQIETKYATIHSERVLAIKKDFDAKESEYKKTIDELTKSKTISVNEKRFGVEAGMMNNKNYYGHATMDVWGPVFIGVHGELGVDNKDNQLGAGLGLRF